MRKLKSGLVATIIMALCFGNLLAQDKQAEKSNEKFVNYDVAPKMTSEFKIEYPDSAKIMGLEGNVLVLGFITKEGKIKDLKIKEGYGNPVFNEAAMNAVKGSNWEPALKDNKPVEVWITIPVYFRLDKDK